jgi:glycosyltransferase involved in cell wall biosynthesis
MKVVLAYNDFKSLSGETVFFRNMVDAMQDRGFEAIACPVRQAEPDTLLGLPSHYMRFPLLQDAGAALARRKDCDVIHFLNSAMCPAGRSIKGPAQMATAHFFIPSYLAFTPPANPAAMLAERCYSAYTSMLERDAFRSMDRMVACSHYLARAMEEAYGLRNTEVIYPGVDTDYFRRVKRVDLRARFSCEHVVMSLGRLHERSKCVSHLIQAMKCMKAAGRTETKLVIVGDGPDRKAYESLARKLGVADDVVFTGRLDFKAKSAVQKSADVVVMPSRYEAYGTVFAETLACEVPVVAYDLRFWKGTYDGAGLFVPPSGGPGALASGICQVLDDAGLRKRLALRAAALMPEHSFSKTVDSYCRLYEELSSGHGKARGGQG